MKRKEFAKFICVDMDTIKKVFNKDLSLKQFKHWRAIRSYNDIVYIEDLINWKYWGEDKFLAFKDIIKYLREYNKGWFFNEYPEKHLWVVWHWLGRN